MSCVLGVGAAMCQQWLQNGCYTDKRAETGESFARGVRMCVCVTIYGFVLIAETASTDKQMWLEDVIITIYPHGLVVGDSAFFIWLLVNEKVTVTVINLVILRMGCVVW